jgi:small-conductance mechanosensitive channel/CRP-like cAMP-binding protein
MHNIVLQSIRMNTWSMPASWLETKTLSEIVRSFQLIAQQDDLLWTAVIFLGTAAVMAVLVRRQRTHIHAALLMFVLALMLVLVSAVPAALGLVLTAKALHTAGLLMLGLALVKLGSIIIFDAVLRFTPFSPPQVLRDLMVAAGYLGVGLWLLSRSGVTLSSIVATSAVMSGVIVFSLQDSLSNILGGLVLQIDECFSVGDWVKIDQTAGRVKEITWRHVAIETRNWDTAIIPNSMLIKSQVLVMGQRSGQPLQQRRWVYFNVDFRVPPNEVIRVVTDAIVTAPVEGCAHDPAPNCILMDFKESYCQYAARYWLTDLAKDDPTDSLVRSRIYLALQRAGIQLSVPAMTNFVESQDQEHQKLHHEHEIDQRLSAMNLAHVELFKDMNDEERRKLAERLRIALFMKGELMTRQGAEAHWLYILTKGSAEVFVSTDAGEQRPVHVMRAGDFFGEMSLLTGAPRTASLRALEDSECYRLDREAFNDILQGRPEIAHYLSELLARRKVEIEAIRQDLDAAARASMIQHQQRSIFDSIHKLFGLGASNPKSEKLPTS